MRLKKWAKEQEINYRTALKWFHAGKIDNAIQMHSGTILVLESKEEAEKFREEK